MQNGCGLQLCHAQILRRAHTWVQVATRGHISMLSGQPPVAGKQQRFIQAWPGHSHFFQVPMRLLALAVVLNPDLADAAQIMAGKLEGIYCASLAAAVRLQAA